MSTLAEFLVNGTPNLGKCCSEHSYTFTGGAPLPESWMWQERRAIHEAATFFDVGDALFFVTGLTATAPLLYPCRRYPKYPWGLYASPPLVAVVGWFLSPPPIFFLWKRGVFPYATCAKKQVYVTYGKKKKQFLVGRKRDLRKKRKKLRNLHQASDTPESGHLGPTTFFACDHNGVEPTTRNR